MLKRTIAMALLAIGSMSAQAANVSLTGNLATGDSIAWATFTLSAPGNVTLKTLSYAGGTNAQGTVIPAGGFDPSIWVFNYATGERIDWDGDGSCTEVAKDPQSGECWDSYLELNSLPAGRYRVAIVQYDKELIGNNVSEGFDRVYSAYINFIDDDGYQRTSAWALDISAVDSAAHDVAPGRAAPAPVPAVGLPALVFGALGIFGAAGFLSRRRKAL